MPAQNLLRLLLLLMLIVRNEDHVGKSLLQIWELTFGPKTKLFFQTLSTRVGQDFKVEARF